ncbi:hypothetical protein MtrunA17_Chr1g0172181 [Medicago truncatula]|uniref:Transmembrane protein n=1 Tax=Medicago truncatula TaxID=3880 RepID=A0A396JRT2_MEDTR|nr:hypothetical protein MtrunA17_Chr1g0172181 [Medicago truncatula]
MVFDEANRGTILCIMTRFLDKVVVPWVVHNEPWRDFGWRGAILTDLSHYLSTL